MAMPDTIYIQLDQDGDPLTFCPTQVNDSDIVYVRADIAGGAPELLVECEKALVAYTRQCALRYDSVDFISANEWTRAIEVLEAVIARARGECEGEGTGKP